MYLLLEDVLEDIRKEVPSNYSLVVEKWAVENHIPCLKPPVPAFFTATQALLWVSILFMEEGHTVIFKSRNGNDRLLSDMREMAHEVLTSRRLYENSYSRRRTF